MKSFIIEIGIFAKNRLETHIGVRLHLLKVRVRILAWVAVVIVEASGSRAYPCER